jgi:hypothetical protein
MSVDWCKIALMASKDAALAEKNPHRPLLTRIASSHQPHSTDPRNAVQDYRIRQNHSFYRSIEESVDLAAGSSFQRPQEKRIP